MLEEEALWLVSQNAKAGSRNGAKLARLAEVRGGPLLAFEATHNNDMATKRPSEEYSQLRSRVPLGIGAPVMLIVNNLWDSRTVHLGLMNGARGHVVAIVAKEVGPALPLHVVVDFPEYRSAPFWEDHPTWVPVGPERRQSKKSPKHDRVHLPLKLAWASQGAGVDAASPGLAFVAMTGTTAWPRMGFKSLPPFGEFLAVRGTKLFAARELFEAKMDRRHKETMLRLGITADEEIRFHVAAIEPCPQEDKDDVVAMSLCGIRGTAAHVLARAQKKNFRGGVGGVPWPEDPHALRLACAAAACTASFGTRRRSVFGATSRTCCAAQPGQHWRRSQTGPECSFARPASHASRATRASALRGARAEHGRR